MTTIDLTSKGLPLSHGFSWDGRMDLTGWWLNEKMDGIRAYWNGSQLLSRSGKLIDAPQFFLEGLPSNTLLDGELWMGRGTFEKLMGVVKSSKENDNGWTSVGFYIFDLPAS